VQITVHPVPCRRSDTIDSLPPIRESEANFIGVSRVFVDSFRDDDEDDEDDEDDDDDDDGMKS